MVRVSQETTGQHLQSAKRGEKGQAIILYPVEISFKSQGKLETALRNQSSEDWLSADPHGKKG